MRPARGAFSDIASRCAGLTGLMVAVADMEEFRAFIHSPEAEAARTEDGVVEGTLQVFTEGR